MPPSLLARVLARAGLVAGLVVFSAGCFAPEPRPEDWLAYGFRGPETTLRSFLTALAGDKPELEYRCLSSDLKRREGGNLLGYLVFRDDLLGRMPYLKAAARAEIESVERLADDRARVHARVDWLFWDETFVVDLVSEDYYELWSESELVSDAYQPFHPARDDGVLVLRIAPPPEVDLAKVTEVRQGREWKIDAFALLEAPKQNGEPDT